MSSNVKFEHQAITATNEDTKTQTATTIDIKCGLQCILKCSSPEDVNDDQSILYGCLKSCLQECQLDDKPAIPVEMTTPKSAGTTVLLPLLLEDITIEEICSIPCNEEDHEVPELICSLCKDVSEFEKSLTIGNICVEIDPCYFPKFCNFCNAINNAGLLDKKSEQQSLTITSNNNPKTGGGWIVGLCQQGMCVIENCDSPNIVKSSKSSGGVTPPPYHEKWGQPMLRDNIKDRDEIICKLIAKLCCY